MALFERRSSEKEECHCLASGDFPYTNSGSSQFTYSPYATGTLPSVTLVLNPRGSESAYVLSPGGPFKWTLLKIWQFLPLPQPPLFFIATSYGDLSSWCQKPGLCGLAWGWDLSLPRHPSWFVSTTHDYGTTCPTTATSLCHNTSLHLSAHLHVSTPPAHLDESSFFKYLVVRLPYSLIFWWFWVFLFWGLVVIFSVVEQGCKASLPILCS